MGRVGYIEGADVDAETGDRNHRVAVALDEESIVVGLVDVLVAEVEAL